MTAVYATYRDAADLLTPGVMGLALRTFELSAVFVVGGLAMLGFAGLASRIHPRLGLLRPERKTGSARPAVSVPSAGRRRA